MKSLYIRHVLFIFLACALSTVQSPVSSAPGQTENGTIQGLVVRGGTNVPLPDVRVTAFQVGSESRTAVTDSNGAFVLRDLSAGANTVQFVVQGYAVRATTVTVKSGETVDGLMMKLTHQGTVNGEIHDAGGNPIANVSVALMTKDYSNDHWQLLSVGSAETDDRGQYRIFGVNPGNYYLRAFLTEPNSGRVYVSKLYPASSDLSDAAQIRVQPDSDILGLNFTFTRAPLYRVRGRVVQEDGGHAPDNVRLSFERVNTLGSDGDNIPYDSSNGTFEIPELPAGKYTLHADVPGNLCGTTIGGFRETGDTTIAVAGADVEDVVIPVRMNACLSGTVKLADGISGDVSGIEFKLVSEKSWAAGSFSGEPNGTIMPVPLVPGTYDLFLLWSSAGYYIKSAMFGNMDITNRSFDFQTSNSTLLHIVLGLKTAALSAIVRDQNNQPYAGATVVLAPLSAEDSVMRDEIASSDQNGQFHFEGAPGDYRMLAFESLEYPAWMEPGFLEKYSSQGTTVRLQENATEMATVRLVTEK